MFILPELHFKKIKIKIREPFRRGREGAHYESKSDFFPVGKNEIQNVPNLNTFIRPRTAAAVFPHF